MPTPIPLNIFEQHIDEKILAHGLKHYERGHVEEPEELELGLYETVVHGSEDHTVRIRIKNNAVTEYHCDCPHVPSDVCKHAVALIFQVQREVLDLPVNVQGDKRTKGSKGSKARKTSTSRKLTVAQQVDRAMAAVPHEELMAYIRTRAIEDASFRQHFLVTCAPEAIIIKHRDHLKRLRAELLACAGRNGYYGWNDSLAAGVVLNMEVEEAKTLVDKGHPQHALPMITAVIEGGSEIMQFADDSGGGLGAGITGGIDLFVAIAQADPDEAFRAKLFSEAQRLRTNYSVVECDWNNDLLPIAATLARNETEAAPLMSKLRTMADEQYGGAPARNVLLAITRRFQGNEAAIAMEEAFLDHTDVRERAIEAAIAAHDWTRARTLAEAGRHVMHNGSPATHTYFWTPYLQRIAQLSNNSQETERLARTLVIGGSMDSMEQFELLRTLVATSEWPAYVDQLLQDLRSGRRDNEHHTIAEICSSEGRWEELLEVVKQERWTVYTYQSVLDDHGTELGKRYPQEVATILADRAEILASRTGAKPEHYQEAVAMLRRIRILGETQLANTIAADWRLRLSRRPRLMKELLVLG